MQAFVLGAIIAWILMIPHVDAKVSLVPNRTWYIVDLKGMTLEDDRLYTRCHPARFTKGNEFYCTNIDYGWEASFTPACHNWGKSCSCNCGSSGYSCEEIRCPDQDGALYDAEGNLAQEGVCKFKQSIHRPQFTAKPDGTLDWVTYLNCYNAKTPCERCAVGYKRMGCERTNSGYCVKCDGIETNMNVRWLFPGENCSIGLCGTCPPGTYETQECGQYNVNVCTSCAEYEPNVYSLTRLYYCPGGRIKPQLCVGSFVEVNEAYTACECQDGSYKQGKRCIECEPGYYCTQAGGRQLCPVDTYSLFAASSCTPCSYTSECAVGRIRTRCTAGSSRPSFCVPCAQCELEGGSDGVYECVNLWGAAP